MLYLGLDMIQLATAEGSAYQMSFDASAIPQKDIFSTVDEDSAVQHLISMEQSVLWHPQNAMCLWRICLDGMCSFLAQVLPVRHPTGHM